MMPVEMSLDRRSLTSTWPKWFSPCGAARTETGGQQSERRLYERGSIQAETVQSFVTDGLNFNR